MKRIWGAHRLQPHRLRTLKRSRDPTFAAIRRRLRRGSFTGVVDLQAAIKRYIAEDNRRARPFVWTKPAGNILTAVSRSP